MPDDSGSFSGGGYPGGGSYSGPATSGTIFNALDLKSTLVTNALLDPWGAVNLLAAPVTDTILWVYDAGGNQSLWGYRVAAGSGKGVQIS